MHTGILILAAGASRRFGGDKRLALLPDGRSLLGASIASALATGFPVRACLRPGETQHAELAATLGAGVIACSDAEAGMGATLAEAVGHCADWDGLLVALADMPHIRTETYHRVADALRQAPLCRPTYRGKPGHPVGFRSELFAELCRLAGDTGAQSVLRRHHDELLEIPLQDAGVGFDVDRPADLDWGREPHL